LAEAGWVAETVLSSTCVKAHRSAHGGKGSGSQAVGSLRGGQTTKVHFLADTAGRSAVVHLTPGYASDVVSAPDVLAAAPGRLKRLITHRGCETNHFRLDLRAGGTWAVIPGKRSRKRPIQHDQLRHKAPCCIEAAFCRLKDFRVGAIRHDKLAADFTSAVVAFRC
jgi:hypothetical protein